MKAEVAGEDGYDCDEASSVLSGKPTRYWRRTEWLVFTGLAFALMAAGVLFFSFAGGRGGPISEATQVTVMVSPSSTAPLGSTVENITTTPIMFEVTPIVSIIVPTDTPEPTPSFTWTPSPSDTPFPTLTDTPTQTDTPRPPTSTPTQTYTPTSTSTSTPSPTPTLSYSKPRLLKPEAGQYFSGAETRIELHWEPVGILKEDEWYGLMLRYVHEGQDIETGAWLKEAFWVVPSYFAGQADEPKRRYEWGIVVVKEINKRSDGSREGMEISPRSEVREFIWR